MSVEAFVDLKTVLEDGLAFERGKRRNSKVTRIHAARPPINKTARDSERLMGKKLNDFSDGS